MKYQLISCSAVAVTLAFPVWGQGSESGGSGLEEVIVTAQKREENLQDVPIAIQAFGSESLRSAGVDNTLQLTAVVPSMSLTFSAGQFQPKLRGIGTTANGPGVENPVALYIDNVYYASQFAGLSDLDDVAQISVLNGPQGTLFGRNATGGVIQITTRDPSDEFELEAKTSFDNYRTSASHVFVGGPLSNTAKLGLSAGYTTQGKGWGTNVANGDDVHQIDDSVKLRGKLILEPSDELRIALSADYFDRTDSLGPNYRPYPGTVPLIGGFRDTGDPYDVDTFRTNHNQTRNYGASANVQYDLGFAQFASTSAYRDLDSERLIVPTASPNPGLTLPSITRVDQFSQELQLVSPSGGALEWTIGGFYFQEHGYVAPLGLVFEGPPLLAADGSGLGRIDIRTKGKTESLAAYGQATVELTPEAHLTAGVRYTTEDRSAVGGQYGFLQGGIPIGLLGPALDDDVDFSKVTYRLAMDYRFNDSLLGYLSFNTGFKSGGFNLFDPTNPPYEPEDLNAYEVGVKSDIVDGRVRLNAAAFYYDYTNIQVARFTTTAVIFNGAEAEIYGIDLDAEAQLTDGFSVRAGASLMHSEFTDFRNAQFSQPIPGGGVFLFPGDATGNRLPYAPESKFNLSANYEHLLRSGGRIKVGMAASYSSKVFGEPDNFLEQDAYTYLNVNAGWTSPEERYGVEVYAQNILDEEVSTLLPTLDLNYLVDYGNPPAIYGVRFTVKVW